MAFDFKEYMANPWTQVGLGILSQVGSGRGTAANVGTGGLLGMRNYQQQQELQQAEQYRQLQLQAEQEKRQQELARQQAMSQFFGQQDPRLAQLAQFDPSAAVGAWKDQAFPAAPTPTDDMREYQAAKAEGFPGGFMEFMLKTKGAAAPQVNVGGANVYLPKQLTEEAKVVGTAYGEMFVDTQKAANEAMANNSKLDRLSELLDQTYTGAGAGAVLSAKRAGQMLGIDMSGVGEAEAATALANEMALQLRNPAGGAGMPGALSDKDREFLVSMVPGLATTPEGRRLMVETRKRINKRNIEVAKLAREYRGKNGSLDEGFFNQLQQYSESNPLFGDISLPAAPAARGGIPLSPGIDALLQKYSGQE